MRHWLAGAWWNNTGQGFIKTTRGPDTRRRTFGKEREKQKTGPQEGTKRFRSLLWAA